MYKNVHTKQSIKQITRYLLNPTVILPPCELHAVEDPNRDKPVCLRTMELQGDSMGTPHSFVVGELSSEKIGVGVMSSLATFETSCKTNEATWSSGTC